MPLLSCAALPSGLCLWGLWQGSLSGAGIPKWLQGIHFKKLWFDFGGWQVLVCAEPKTVWQMITVHQSRLMLEHAILLQTNQTHTDDCLTHQACKLKDVTSVGLATLFCVLW